MANGPAARTVSGTSPRLYPVGKAVILLAVCAPELAGRRLTIDGRRIQALRAGRLALLVAYVDQEAYAPEEIDRLRGDTAAFAIEARVLEQAVSRAEVHGRVLPMRALTVYPHAEALERAANENAARWTRALARLGTKRECAIHLFAGPHAPPGGEPYVARVVARTSRNGRAPALPEDAPISAHALAVWRDATALAIATRTVHVGDRRGALWSVVVLLDEDDVDTLAAVLERSVAAGAPLGVTAYLEAPRPPFTFI